MDSEEDVQVFRTDFMRYASAAEVNPAEQSEAIARKLIPALLYKLQAYAASRDERIEELPITIIVEKLIGFANTTKWDQEIILQGKQLIATSNRLFLSEQ